MRRHSEGDDAKAMPCARAAAAQENPYRPSEISADEKKRMEKPVSAATRKERAAGNTPFADVMLSPSNSLQAGTAPHGRTPISRRVTL
jgi:hypothetical protein